MGFSNTKKTMRKCVQIIKAMVKTCLPSRSKNAIRAPPADTDLYRPVKKFNSNVFVTLKSDLHPQEPPKVAPVLEDRPCKVLLRRKSLTRSEEIAIKNYRVILERQRRAKDNHIREGRGECRIVYADAVEVVFEKSVYMHTLTETEVKIIAGRRRMEKESRGRQNEFK